MIIIIIIIIILYDRGDLIFLFLRRIQAWFTSLSREYPNPDIISFTVFTKSRCKYSPVNHLPLSHFKSFANGGIQAVQVNFLF